MRKINIYIPNMDDAELRELVKKTDIKYAEHVRRAITMYLESTRRTTRYIVQEVPVQYTTTPE